jgi:hypothetical protein
MECVTVRRGRAGPRVRSAALVAVRAAVIGMTLAVVAVGCGNRPSSAARLVDGSTPPPLPHAFDDLSGAVVTRVGVLRAADLGVRGQACLRSFRPEFSIPPATIIVERTGVIGASLTFRDRRRRFVLGCDRTEAPRGGDAGPWCARSVGRLFGNRLRDPRVDILCRSAAGDRVGFGWIEPAPASRWFVVGHGSRSELYEVVAGLPVRVASRDVDVTTSSATFDVAEYDANGKEVRRRRLRVGVAG